MGAEKMEGHVVRIWKKSVRGVCVLGIIINVMFFFFLFASFSQRRASFTALKRSLNELKSEYAVQAHALEKLTKKRNFEANRFKSQISALSQENITLKLQNEQARKRIESQLCKLKRSQKRWRAKVNEKYPNLLCSVTKEIL